jgi:hypothetical protein
MSCQAMSPLNGESAFIVREEKIEEFLNYKRDKYILEKILKKAS